MEQQHPDPFQVLGVSRDSTKAQIKSAYYKLALKHHPDKVNGNAAEKKAAAERFASISHAYEALTNPNVTTAQNPDASTQHGCQHSGYYDPPAAFGSACSPFFGADPFMSGIFHDPGSLFFGRGGSGDFGRRFGGDGLLFNTSFHFTDPFELFEQTFGGLRGDSISMSSSKRIHNDPMAAMMSSMMGGGGTSGGMGSTMSGGEGGVFFQSFRSTADGGGTGMVHMNSTSTRTEYDPSTGETKRITNTTKTINGEKTNRVETTIVYPDGRQETTVQENRDVPRMNALPPTDPMNQLEHRGDQQKWQRSNYVRDNQGQEQFNTDTCLSEKKAKRNVHFGGTASRKVRAEHPQSAKDDDDNNKSNVNCFLSSCGSFCRRRRRNKRIKHSS